MKSRVQQKSSQRLLAAHEARLGQDRTEGGKKIKQGKKRKQAPSKIKQLTRKRHNASQNPTQPQPPPVVPQSQPRCGPARMPQPSLVDFTPPLTPPQHEDTPHRLRFDENTSLSSAPATAAAIGAATARVPAAAAAATDSSPAIDAMAMSSLGARSKVNGGHRRIAQAVAATNSGHTSSEIAVVPPSTLSIPNYNQEMMRTERHFYFVGCLCLVTYGFLLLVVNGIVHSGHYEVLSPTPFERSCAITAFVALLLMMTLQYVPVFVYKRRKGYSSMSGVVFLGLVVVAVATTSNLLMAFAANPPIIVDPFTGARVHMFRWCEWTCLAACMTFLVEGCDVPDQQTKSVLGWAYIHAASQGVSALCGLIFPLCRDRSQWMACMLVSCATFAIIFPRLQAKRKRFKTFEMGTKLDEQEIYNRVLIAVQLMTTCVIGWSVLVSGYFIFCCFGPMYAPEGSMLAHPAASMVVDSILDVFLKSFYNFYIIAMHERVFDEGARAKRRLEELRQTMWTTSSDVLALSVRSMSGVVTTTVSPTFFKLLQRPGSYIDIAKTSNRSREKIMAGGGMCFELTPATLKTLFAIAQGGTKSLVVIKPSLYDFGLQPTGPPTIEDTLIPVPGGMIGAEEMQALAILIARSWQCLNRDTILPHDLVLRDGPEGQLETIQCEARVTRLEESALFVVVRDISERFLRFEAEKLALSEMTARKKDSEANRFTRHEVKNGLLASLGLCDGIADLAKQKQTSEILEKLSDMVGSEHQEDLRTLSSTIDSIVISSKELDSTLHEVLDTVLTEAMARDVIHGVYRPQKEPVDVVEMLKGNFQAERFSVATSPGPLPQFFADPHLLKCIHRNAISNACKYGARRAPIETNLTYDSDKKVFTMEVVNQAGDHHSELHDLGNNSVDKVFEKGKRLHSSLGSEASGMAHRSSGDGAWIMLNCAVTLGGACSISFQESRTVFSMWCPLDIYEPLQGPVAAAASFRFPSNTWAIALDDTKIQRKLVKRLFGMVGIEESRTIILGETMDEIATFDTWAAEFIANHPDDYFLLIIDENLDVAMDDVQLKQSTFSGSLLVQSLRHQLLPEQECQMLALIRSANDSKHDVAVYKSRAHGFLAKAPLKREFIKETLAQQWGDRFASIMEIRDSIVSDDGSSTTEARNRTTCSSSLSRTQSTSSLAFDVMESIRSVDALIERTKSNRQKLDPFWPEIWEKLHAFKGDLVSLNDSHLVVTIAAKINNMRGSSLPVTFADNYKALRALIRQLENGSEDRKL